MKAPVAHGPNDPPRIPNTLEGLDILRGTTWERLDTEVKLSYFKSACRSLPFPPKILKDFNYSSSLHLVYWSHQTKKSIMAGGDLVWFPELS